MRCCPNPRCDGISISKIYNYCLFVNTKRSMVITSVKVKNVRIPLKDKQEREKKLTQTIVN